MAGSEKKKADDLLQEGYAKYYTAINPMRSLDWATRTKVRMWRKRPL